MTSHTTAPRLTRKFDDAMAYAAEKHRSQTRKGGDIPYLGHLLSVAGLVIEAGGTETPAIAALLHDAAADQGPGSSAGIAGRNASERESQDDQGDEPGAALVSATEPSNLGEA